MRRHLPLRTLCVLGDAALVAVLTVLTAAFMLGLHHGGDRTSTLFGRSVLVVRSGSMSPTIDAGDIVLADRRVPDSDITPGNVISYRSVENPRLVVTHRVISTELGVGGERSFRTRGDANKGADTTPVGTDQLVGVVTGRIPKIGFMIVAVSSPRVVGLFVAGAVLAHMALLLARSADATRVDRRPRGTSEWATTGGTSTQESTTWKGIQ